MAVPTNRVEAAIFDRVAEAEIAEGGGAAAKGSSGVLEGGGNVAESRGVAVAAPEPLGSGIVMIPSVPMGVTAADLVAFFDAPSDSTPAPESGRVLNGVCGVHLLSLGDEGSSSTAPAPTCQAFVEFWGSDAADDAVARRDGRSLPGYSARQGLEVFRATEEHMAAVMRAECQKETAAAARRAEEARAAAETRRLETIAAARAARAAEKERQ